MTTIWQAPEGHYEDGCGCHYELDETKKRFKRTWVDPKCTKHADRTLSVPSAESEDK